MDTIIKTTKKFIRKELKNNINFETLKECIQKSGYVIIFYKQGHPNDIIIKYNKSDSAAKYHAFTIKRNDAKYVFIDSDISYQDKLYYLAHELAHIVLGHLDSNANVADFRYQEMQAEAFAHAVLNYKSHKGLYAVIISAVLVVVLAICGITYHIHALQADSTTVYITPTGKKYHSENCRYVQDKDCTAVSELQAEKNYEPCKVCNP